MFAERLRLGLDRVAFAQTALGFNPDPWQTRVLASDSRRMLLNVSRQAGKSTTAAIIGLHRALHYPGSLTLLVSPSQRQSSELFRKVRDWVSALEVAPELEEDNALSMKLANGARVISLPSKEGTVRGFSAPDLIIEDEASRVDDQLHAALRPMLATSGGRLILMSTPWGKRGHFHREWTEGGDGWERYEVKAYDCPRITPDFLADERAALGPSFYRQEYECSFEETEDSVFTFDFIEGLHDDDVEPLYPLGLVS